MTAAFWSLLCGCSNVKNVDVDAFAKALDEGACILDVRTPEEYLDGCIPGALNIDWNAEGFLDAAVASLPKGAPVWVYCRSGRRSALAANALRKAGFKKVNNLLGGYEAWTAAGKRIDQDAKYAAGLLPAGSEAPDFELRDLEGKAVRLSDFRGRSVVLVFWASWCPDCRAEVPELKAMCAAADTSEVQFVSVSFDREFDALRDFVAENGLPGAQLFDPAGKKDSQVGAAFGVRWIPSLYLIDASGRVKVSSVMAWKIADALGAGSDASGAGAIGEGASGTGRGALCEDDSCEL